LNRKAINSKKEYIEALNDALNQTLVLKNEFQEISVYRSIFNQLVFIKAIIVDRNQIPNEEEIESLTLGSIAVKNFDYNDDPYAKLLIEIYGNIDIYESMPTT
jgi:hypothetical protein